MICKIREPTTYDPQIFQIRSIAGGFSSFGTFGNTSFSFGRKSLSLVRELLIYAPI